MESKLMAKNLPPGPRDERGVLAARILTAARDEFAQNGWAGTTIRAVARSADVDPALIYHYFGSKEALLDAATAPPQRWLEGVAKTWSTPVDALGAELLRLMLGAWADDEIGPVLRAVLLSAAHERVDSREAAQGRRRPVDGGVAAWRRRPRPTGAKWPDLVAAHGAGDDALRLADRAGRFDGRRRGGRRRRTQPAALHRG